jgi:hypothetical protein
MKGFYHWRRREESLLTYNLSMRFMFINKSIIINLVLTVYKVIP